MFIKIKPEYHDPKLYAYGIPIEKYEIICSGIWEVFKTKYHYEISGGVMNGFNIPDEYVELLEDKPIKKHRVGIR